MMDSREARALLRRLFDAALAAADPARCVPPLLPARPEGRTVVIAAGKAAASMARAVERHWQGPLEGVAVTRYGHGLPCDRIEVIEASHPVPDDRGEAAARRLLETVSGLGADDLLLCLISGGGSALLGLPAPGLTLADKKAANKALLASGAPIGEMNTVRKHLSAIKGGRLAQAAHPARVVTIGISDVPGDDPSVIASGPTVPDATTLEDARAVIAKYRIDLPAHLRTHLEDPASETPKPGDRLFDGNSFVLAARPADMVAAAVAGAEAEGLKVISLGADIEGEAHEVGAAHARLALEQADGLKRDDRPIAIISGGETTVTVDRECGRGGRNCEYLLALAVGLGGRRGIHALACDTDGIDGSENNAGAIIDPLTPARAAAAGHDLEDCLRRHDSWSVFAATGDLVVTGPTLTNVNDLRIILVLPPAAEA